MSIVSLSNSAPTITADEVTAAATKTGFTIPEGGDATAFLLLQNSFDAVAASVAAIPDYVDPRLEPTPIEGGERKWTRQPQQDNRLNAWSHRALLKAAKPASNKLAGKTFAIKDNVSVAGAPLVLGTSPELFRGGKHPISTIDATVVKRILEAGGTIIGTAVCENLSLFPVSVSAETGPVHNAWAKGYITGGSSSGCGSLISAKDVQEWKEQGKQLPFDTDAVGDERGVDMAIGGDQGGSIRLPASYSGIYGLKPTNGLVPYTGIASLLPMIDSTGPMARSVDDIALFLGVIAGYDGIDFRQTPETPLRENVPDYFAQLSEWRTSKQQAGEWTSTTAAKGLRIGILKEAFEVTGLDPAVASLVLASVSRFTTLGATVSEISIPFHHHGPAIWTVAGREAIPRFFSNRAPDSLSHTLPGLDPLPITQTFYEKISHTNPAVLNVLLNSALLEAKYGPNLTRKSHMHAHQLRAAYDAAFADVNVLITPTTPTVAFKHPAQRGVMDVALTAVGITLNTCPINVTGHPALSMPCGWALTPDGEARMPVGMQIVAKRWCELDIFKAACAWEVGGKGLDGL
ncbi:amidase [Delphinella strobiligena]|nr:amidase [Delphinella strobiligena]